MKKIVLVCVLALLCNTVDAQRSYRKEKKERNKIQAAGCVCDMDSDGDGVNDCFDRCADTPAGAAVDTHGCVKDTDNDGVPDYKDKQLITPSDCFPVDANGVGACKGKK